MKKKLFITVNNHFDLTWRRCFDRRFTYKGLTFASYADIQEYYIEDNLLLCAQYPFYKFQIESPAVVRKYLSRHPDRKAGLQALINENRLWISATGENIVDGNIPGGESIVRNFVMGQRWLLENFGFAPRLANRDDAFGNCSQLPQILRGCGLQWVKGLSYTPCPKPYWRGLDGSVVYTRLLPVAGMGGGWRKYAPCPTCRGVGTDEQGVACASCRGRGIDREKNELDRQPITLQADIPEHATVMVGGEEILPDATAAQWCLSLDPQEFDARFAFEEEQYELLQDKIENSTPASEDVFRGELNPNNAGCFVTRAKTKQQARLLENRLLRLEAVGAMAAFAGCEYPKEEIDGLWRDYLFTLFHDAVTATLVDAAYEELLHTWKELHQSVGEHLLTLQRPLMKGQEYTYSLLNHLGISYTGPATLLLEKKDANLAVTDESGNPVPVLADELQPDGSRAITIFVKGMPPFSAAIFRLQAQGQTRQTVAEKIYTPMCARGIQSGILRADALKAGDSVQECVGKLESKRLCVSVGKNGVLSVFDKQLGCAVAGGGDLPAFTLYLESDAGSPWATVLPGQERLDLLPFTWLHKIEQGDGYSLAVYFTDLPQTLYGSINGVAIRYAVTLYEEADQVDVSFRIDWNAYNTRLRFGVNTQLTGRHIYEVPYGVQERKPYTPTFSWTGANGDWPTQNFAGISAEHSVCLMNRGLASYCIEEASHGSRILLSLLRSPTMPTYLHELDAYSMLDFDGMRDTGEHEFHLALKSYGTPLPASDAVLDAHCFNTELLSLNGIWSGPKMPTITSECARVSAVKLSDKMDGMVYRIVEYKGIGGSIAIELPENIERVEKVNLLESAPELAEIINRRAVITVRPFEIASIKFSVTNGSQKNEHTATSL